MFLRTVLVRVVCSLSSLWLVLSLSRKTTSLLEQDVSHFLPTFLVLPASCLAYSATAASRGQHQLPVLTLVTFCPPSCSGKLGNFFLQASGCPVHSGHFSVHKHLWSLPSTLFTYLALTKSKRRTWHPVHGTAVKQHYNFHQNSKINHSRIPQISEASSEVN